MEKVWTDKAIESYNDDISITGHRITRTAIHGVKSMSMAHS